MAKQKSKSQLPPAGSAFLFPTADGRLAVCRVLRVAKSPEWIKSHRRLCLVATSPWIGYELPPLDAPVLREILHLTHHSWKNQPHIVWTMGPPTAAFKLIGIISPTAAERKLTSDLFAYWSCDEPLGQWSWDHEREAVLELNAAEARYEERHRDLLVAERKTYLKTVTLEHLANTKYFQGWLRSCALFAELSRSMIAEAIHKLQALGLKSTKDEQLAVLHECVAAFNELNQRENFMCSDKNEDICRVLEALCHASALADKFPEVLQGRDAKWLSVRLEKSL